MTGITIIGAGRLGAALARGLRDALPDQRLLLVQRPGPIAEARVHEGFEVVPRLPLDHRARALFVVVKPRDMSEVLDDVAARVRPDVPLISLASGMTLEALGDRLGPEFSPYRARANVFVAHRRGTVLLADRPRSRFDAEVEALLSLLGQVHRVSEADMVRLTWYSSSVPIVLVSQLVARSLESADPELGEGLAGIVLDGLEALVAELRRAGPSAALTAAAFRSLVEQVATPGGMNHAALRQLDEAGVWAALDQARDLYLASESTATKTTATKERA